ncbi:MAG: adenylate/guanylate cyclase domain-containing protein [Elusimicrobiota bacterium]
MADRKKLLSSKELFDLLRRRTRANADELDGRIERTGVQELAVLMADSSGFSRKTQDYGVLQFLAAMTHCYDRLIPMVKKFRGVCVSHNADNLLAVFPRPADAVAAAKAMHGWLAERNKGLDDADQYNICIGIHYGKVLRLRDNVFGDRVNVAAKVGEDVAGKDETLITREVHERVRGKFQCARHRTVRIGGRDIELFKVKG